MKTIFNIVTMTVGLLIAGSSFAQRGPRGGEVVRISCASTNYRYNTCSVNGDIEYVRLVRQDSRTSCNENSTWGYSYNYVWVDQGCRGEFEVVLRGRGRSQQIDCASTNYRYNTCSTNGYIRDARLIRQNSRTSCVEGSTWGYGSDYIWVDRGCRGVFEVISGGGHRRVVVRN